MKFILKIGKWIFYPINVTFVKYTVYKDEDNYDDKGGVQYNVLND